jgi:thiol-disulfide isomerase/thioredoxin
MVANSIAPLPPDIKKWKDDNDMRKIHKLQRYSILVRHFHRGLSIIQPADFPAHAQADLPVVRAVLFYSPSCGHCHLVIQETILPLIEQYGAQFEIIGVDITQPQGQVFFAAAFKMFDLESAGVPFLVIGNEYLIGSLDIPQKLPGLIETHLAQGGIDWPDIPGLRDAIHASQTAQAPTPTDIPPTSAPASIPTQTPAPALLEPDPPPGDSFSLPSKPT